MKKTRDSDKLTLTSCQKKKVASGRMKAASAKRTSASAPEKKTRVQFTLQQTNILNAAFEETQFPANDRVEEIVQLIGLPARRVRSWFGNRRSSLKRKGNKDTTELQGHMQGYLQDHTYGLLQNDNEDQTRGHIQNHLQSHTQGQHQNDSPDQFQDGSQGYQHTYTQCKLPSDSLGQLQDHYQSLHQNYTHCQLTNDQDLDQPQSYTQGYYQSHTRSQPQNYYLSQPQYPLRVYQGQLQGHLQYNPQGDQGGGHVSEYWNKWPIHNQGYDLYNQPGQGHLNHYEGGQSSWMANPRPMYCGIGSDTDVCEGCGRPFNPPAASCYPVYGCHSPPNLNPHQWTMNQSGETAVGWDYRDHDPTGNCDNYVDEPNPDNSASMTTMSFGANNMELRTPYHTDPEVNCGTEQRLCEQPEVSISCSKQQEVENYFDGNYPEESSVPQRLYQSEDCCSMYEDLSASSASSNYTSVSLENGTSPSDVSTSGPSFTGSATILCMAESDDTSASYMSSVSTFLEFSHLTDLGDNGRFASLQRSPLMITPPPMET